MSMEFGFMLLPRSLEETRIVAKQGEEAGFAWMGVADSPAVYQESYLHQLVALNETERLRVGPMVTHVVARHPLIVGNLLATLNEFSGGRAVGTLATGNSAARGLGMKPATVAQLGQAIDAMRGYFDGKGGEFTGRSFGESRIPATGILRQGPPLLVAADGPLAAVLAGTHGDGIFYGGTMEPEVLARRVEVGKQRPEQKVWLGPAVSMGETVEEVLEDMGAMVIAQANRAFRGDLTERGIPEELHEDIRELWRRYDYAFHADNTRPENMDLVSPALAEYLVEHFVVWGDADRWKEKMAFLTSQGCDGVHFILGQGDQRDLVAKIGDRLAEIGLMNPAESQA